VARVSGLHAAYPRPVGITLQPTRELGPDAAPHHATAVLAQSLAGDDQHDAQVERGGLFEEARHRPLGRRQRHAMKVELGLRRPPPARQSAIDVAVEGQRLDGSGRCRPYGRPRGRR